MTKLLGWGDALFLVRCELGKLQLQRIVIHAATKKVSWCPCSIKYDEASALPADARLVAAKEVEDTELAIYYPLLVFQATGGSDREPPVENLSVLRKRQRIAKQNTCNSVDDASSEAQSLLFFCTLYETDSNDVIGLRLLNKMEIWTRDENARGDDTDASTGKYCNSLQCFVTDGPHILLFQRNLQKAMILKRQRGTQEDTCGFYVWRKQVDVFRDLEDHLSRSFEVVSCVYVSDTQCSASHLLIHTLQKSDSFLADRDFHVWNMLRLDLENSEVVECHYLASQCSGIPSKPESITCCCFITELNEWEVRASVLNETTATLSWDIKPAARSSRPEINVSTLVVTGTASNTIYVQANGIELVSYVLPFRPVDIFLWDNNVLSQHHVLCVRCDDAEHSFFMLGFSSDVQNVSMDLLLSFTHVGHACIGNFAQNYTGDSMAFCQVHLLNYIPDANSSSIEDKGGADRSTNDRQLIKRSVLVTQKSRTRLSCHRLRLFERNELKHGPHSQKRSNNGKKISSESTSRLGSDPFRYIERVQKASSRDKNVNQDDKETNCLANTLASQSQLGKLVNSLTVRLKHGARDLERLQVIVSDKDALTRHVINLITRQCQLQLSNLADRKEHYDCNNLANAKSFVDMKTIVSAPLDAATMTTNVDEAREKISSYLLETCKLQIVLQQFRVLRYSPSSSLVHAEVLLKNLSGLTLDDSFVVLTAPEEPAVQSWTCSSTTVSEFLSATDMADESAGNARFQLELSFAPKYSFFRQRKPLRLILWLHWSASRDDHVSEKGLKRRPCATAIAIASVQMYPDDVLAANENSFGGASDHESSSKEQLLFLSSGSNLATWFANSKSSVPVVGSIIRPTFSITDLSVRPYELMLYEMSRMVANLPADVYVMHNPLQLSHLRSLQRLLHSMRQELLSPIELTTQKNWTRMYQQEDFSSLRRSMQHKTDLQANKFLHSLQKRVNFHTMWFDATGVEIHGTST